MEASEMSTPKSPNSPSRPLESCFNIALDLYDSFPNATFSSTQIASVVGMSATSGTFKSLVSDLKQYGLVDTTAPSEYAIAQCVKDYSISDRETQKSIRYRCAVSPQAFSSILSSQGNHLPKLEILEGILRSKHNFNKEKAKKTAKALLESLNWAEALDAKGNVVAPSNFTPSDDRCTDWQEAGFRDTTPSETTALIPNHLPPDNVLTVDIPLDSDRVVHIQYPQDLNQREAEKIGNVLKALTYQPSTEEG